MSQMVSTTEVILLAGCGNSSMVRSSGEVRKFVLRLRGRICTPHTGDSRLARAATFSDRSFQWGNPLILEIYVVDKGFSSTHIATLGSMTCITWRNTLESDDRNAKGLELSRRLLVLSWEVIDILPLGNPNGSFDWEAMKRKILTKQDTHKLLTLAAEIHEVREQLDRL